MRQDEVQIGGEYRVRVGQRLARVKVLRRLNGRGRARFLCVTQDTRREIKPTAARLRPLVETRTKKPALQPAAWDGSVGDRWLPAVPVPGLLGRGNRPVLQLSQANAAGVCRIVDREHVAEGLGRIARVVRAAIGRSVQWRTIPRSLRRGIIYAAASRHADNRATYRAVMRHDPLPSPRAVAEAVAVACGLGREPL